METTSVGAVTEVAKATGVLAKITQWFSTPKQTIKQADANAYAIERAIEVAEKHPGWNISYEDGKLTLSECTPEELVARTQSRMLAEAVKKESNREKVAMLAAKEVQQSKKVSDESVDEDWLTRFFHIAEDVSSEDMQLVWSKILSGEIIQPGRFSLRTLETIRNVSKQEAEIFQRMLPLLMKSTRDYFIVSNSDILKKYGLSYENILRLNECGLLNISSTTHMWHLITNKRPGIVYNDKKTIAILGIDSAEIRISYGVYVLTKAGTELYSILEHKCSNEYVGDLMQYIQDSNKGKCVITVAEND